MSAPRLGEQAADRNQEATVYVGNLDERVTDALIWELMIQAGPVASCHLPKDRVSMSHQGFGFCEFVVTEDAEYACKIMNQIKLFGKPIRVNMASSDRKQLDIGANLFVGSLDPGVDERTLWDAFSNFGTLVQTAKIARDPGTGASKGYGFISYDSFESADAAIAAMDGGFLMNKAITVQYAFKKNSEGATIGSERHGTQAERLLAAQAKKNTTSFAPAPPPPPPPSMTPMTGANAVSMPPGMPQMMPGMPQMPGMPPIPPGYPAMSMPGQQPPMQFYAGQQPPQQSFGMPPPPPGFQQAYGAPGMPPPPMGFAQAYAPR